VYREVTRYPNVLRATVPGNPDPLRPAELHARAWAIVEPELARAREEAAARFRAGAARGELATDDLGAAVAAADAGRVDTLFVASGVERWGRLDRGTGAVVVHDDQEPGDDDLLDLAAVRTLLTSGTVYAVPSDEVPGGTDVAVPTAQHVSKTGTASRPIGTSTSSTSCPSSSSSRLAVT